MQMLKPSSGNLSEMLRRRLDELDAESSAASTRAERILNPAAAEESGTRGAARSRGSREVPT